MTDHERAKEKELEERSEKRKWLEKYVMSFVMERMIKEGVIPKSKKPIKVEWPND